MDVGRLDGALAVDGSRSVKLVDTATLAVALGVTPGHVRRLARDGKIQSIGKKAGRVGRPTLVFDLDAAFNAVRGGT